MLEERIYYTKLYDYYGNLLTDKQKEYFEDYYFSNLSLQEISENYNVSRNAIHKQLKETIEKLKYYEANLKLLEKCEKINNIIKSLDEDLQNKIKEWI